MEFQKILENEMILWKIIKNNNKKYYDIVPYKLKDYIKEYGFFELKNSYFSHKKARKIANKKNRIL